MLADVGFCCAMVVEEPVSILSLNNLVSAQPEASVSRQPFLPQWQIILLLNKGSAGVLFYLIK